MDPIFANYKRTDQERMNLGVNIDIGSKIHTEYSAIFGALGDVPTNPLDSIDRLGLNRYAEKVANMKDRLTFVDNMDSQMDLKDFAVKGKIKKEEKSPESTKPKDKMRDYYDHTRPVITE